MSKIKNGGLDQYGAEPFEQQQFGTAGVEGVNTVVWWRELDEVGNECTSHNFSLFVIFLPKISKIDGNLTKFWQKQFFTVFLRHGV